MASSYTQNITIIIIIIIELTTIARERGYSCCLDGWMAGNHNLSIQWKKKNFSFFLSFVLVKIGNKWPKKKWILIPYIYTNAPCIVRIRFFFYLCCLCLLQHIINYYDDDDDDDEIDRLFPLFARPFLPSNGKIFFRWLSRRYMDVMDGFFNFFPFMMTNMFFFDHHHYICCENREDTQQPPPPAAIR